MTEANLSIREAILYRIANIEVATELVAITKRRLNHAYDMSYGDLFIELEQKYSNISQSLETASAELVQEVKTILTDHSVLLSTQR